MDHIIHANIMWLNRSITEFWLRTTLILSTVAVLSSLFYAILSALWFFYITESPMSAGLVRLIGVGILVTPIVILRARIETDNTRTPEYLILIGLFLLAYSILTISSMAASVNGNISQLTYPKLEIGQTFWIVNTIPTLGVGLTASSTSGTVRASVMLNLVTTICGYIFLLSGLWIYPSVGKKLSQISEQFVMKLKSHTSWGNSSSR